MKTEDQDEITYLRRIAESWPNNGQCYHRVEPASNASRSLGQASPDYQVERQDRGYGSQDQPRRFWYAIRVREGKRLSGKLLVGWVQPTNSPEKAVAFTHPTIVKQAFPDSL